MRRVALVLGKVCLLTQLLGAQTSVSDSTQCTTHDRANRIDVPEGLAAWIQSLPLASRPLSTRELTLPSPDELGIQRRIFQQAQRQGLAILRRDEERRRRIIRGLGFSDGSPCLSGPPFTVADIDVDKSLFIHDRETLDAGNFTIMRTLDLLAAQAVAAGAGGTTADLIFQRLWDTQNRSPGLVPRGAQCDDDNSRLNGFPLTCPRPEGQQAANPGAMALYRPIALVNRMDLAHEGWRNCGEYRIVYGRRRALSGTTSVADGPFTRERAFIIFEAVLPNPRPGCRSGCKPVAEFWASLSTLTAGERAAELERFFYQGLPGFRPVVHIDHYSGVGATSAYGSSGSGQIRTNQRLGNDPWALREYHLALHCDLPCRIAGLVELSVVPTMTKVNPYGWLWNEEVATGANNSSLLTLYMSRAVSFQAEVLVQVSSLGQDDINKFGYAVSLDHDAAESNVRGQPPEDYLELFNNFTFPPVLTAGLFRSDFTAAAGGLTPPLSANQVVRRASANSCAGCHHPGMFGLTGTDALGPAGSNVTSFPQSLAVSPGTVFTPGFVHTSEVETPAGIHEISPALKDVFLPARRQFLVDQLNAPTCPCVRTFGFLPAARQRRARAIEMSVIKELDPLITKSREALVQRLHAKDVDMAEIVLLRREIADLEAQQERATVIRLGRAGVRVAPVAVDERAQVMRVDTRSARGDAKRRDLLVTRAVLQVLKSEPPRRTVTGHFRVH